MATPPKSLKMPQTVVDKFFWQDCQRRAHLPNTRKILEDHLAAVWAQENLAQSYAILRGFLALLRGFVAFLRDLARAVF